MKLPSKLLFLLTSAAFVATSTQAAPIVINGTNFSVTNTGAPVPSVSNTYTANTSASGHVGLQYIGGTDFLNSDQRFTLTFNYTGTGNVTGGAAFWFGTATSANWVFVNEQNNDPTPQNDLLRNFTGRNLQAMSGGSVPATDTILNADFLSGTNYTLTIDRTLNAGNYFLDIKVRNPSSTVIGDLSGINVGTDAAWGVTLFAPAANASLANTTTTITSLDVTAIPEPSSLALLGGAVLLFGVLRRPSLRRG